MFPKSRRQTTPHWIAPDHVERGLSKYNLVNPIGLSRLAIVAAQLRGKIALGPVVGKEQYPQRAYHESKAQLVRT